MANLIDDKAPVDERWGGLLPVVKRYGINAAPNGNEQKTNIVLPSTAVVMDVWLRVRTAETTGVTPTIDVGTSNNPNGFLSGLSTASIGLFRGKITETTRGVLLVDDVGTNNWAVDTTSGGNNHGKCAVNKGKSSWRTKRARFVSSYG
jgi:hypothetical protein